MKFPPSNREQKANKGSVAVAAPSSAGFPSDDGEPREQREKHFSGGMEARRAEQIHS